MLFEHSFPSSQLLHFFVAFVEVFDIISIVNGGNLHFVLFKVLFNGFL